MDWLSALDFDRALSNVQTDIRADWYRDPWDWPELTWLVPNHLTEHAVPRLNSSGVKRAAHLDVTKENFAVRPAVVLDPLDRLLYQALVDCLSVKLTQDLTPWAYGWRLPPRSRRPGEYARNDDQWEAFRDHLRRLAAYDHAALLTDVVSFFSSIPLDPLCEEITRRGGNRPAERLRDMVASWYRSTGRGLPQRSGASASLAHMYLRPLDDIIGRFNAMPRLGKTLVPEGRALRWMDDIWLFGRSELSLREAQIAIQAGMRDLGLQMNIGKTSVIRDEQLAEAVFEIEHSAVDNALRRDDDGELDESLLDGLIDNIIESPETAERTTIRFATTRMRDHSLFARVPDMAARLSRMPQAPDHLARLFRDCGAWEDLQADYVTYAKRWASRLPWAVGQLGTMFPSSAGVEASIVDYFSETLSSGKAALPLIGVASQRLAAWRPTEARALLRDPLLTKVTRSYVEHSRSQLLTLGSGRTSCAGCWRNMKRTHWYLQCSKT